MFLQNRNIITKLKSNQNNLILSTYYVLYRKLRYLVLIKNAPIPIKIEGDKIDKKIKYILTSFKPNKSQKKWGRGLETLRTIILILNILNLESCS